MSATQNQPIPELESFNFDSLSALAKQVLDYHARRDGKDKERIKEVRKRIADFSEKYLEKMSYGISENVKEEIKKKIEIMRNSDPNTTIILMSAHQPNLFAYSGVLRKIALLKALEQRLVEMGTNKDNIICFYGFADHDFVTDRVMSKWVRSAEMPAPLKREGTLRLNITIDKKDYFLPSNIIAKPTKEKIDSWRSQIDSWINENSSLAVKYIKSYNTGIDGFEVQKIAKKNYADFWKEVEKAQEKASSLAEFSSLLMATEASNAIESPVVFANYSDCYSAFGKEYEWLLSNSKIYSQTVEKGEAKLKELGSNSGLSEDVDELLPLWLKCSCGSKYRLVATSQDVFNGKCMHCGKEVKYTFDELMALVKSSPELFEPRSISMILAFSKAFDISCYIGGKDGMRYLMHTKAISQSLNLPLPPMTYWNVADQYIGIETLAAAWEIERISGTYNLISKGKTVDNALEAAQSAAADMSSKMQKGEIPKTSVSERESQLLEMIPKSLEKPSCAVGYAINITLDSTYKQWIKFLLENGNLHDPVKMKSSLVK
jgi:hypothetical protein